MARCKTLLVCCSLNKVLVIQLLTLFLLNRVTAPLPAIIPSVTLPTKIPPPVQVTGGMLQGVRSPDESYVAYYGVPYAKVTDRFREAVPDPKWNGIKRANKKNIECAQRVDQTTIKGVEDCLILNVYVPNNLANTPGSVIVFIHGGGYLSGSSIPSMYGPDNLVKKGVILVTLNYRLDNLGFLCLRIKEAPGNIGLKDQVLALKWVNQNIQTFGGNPNDVTLFGESAGAASTIYHLVSPMSEGLFKKIILDSGSTFGYFFQYDPIFIAHRLAAQFGQDSDNLQDIVEALNTKSTRDLLLTRVPRKIGDQRDSELIFVPCLEADIPGVDRFLLDNPYNLIIQGKYTKVPILMGFNSEEGYFFTALENDTTVRNLNFFDALPRDLDFPSIQTKKNVALEAKTIYLPSEPISRKSLVKFSKYEGESSITASVAITIDLFLATSDEPLYPYMFNHSGILNIAKNMAGFEKEPGATHEDELYYLFSNKYMPKVLPQRDVDIIKKMSTLWTNFAKFSNPTPETSTLVPVIWPQATPGDTQVFVIDNDLTTAPLWNERLLFWKRTYSKYRRLGDVQQDLAIADV